MRLVEAVEAIPGVNGAGIVNQIPLNGCCFSTAIFQEGPSARPSTGERVAFLPVNSGYFRTMGIPLRRGRLLTDGAEWVLHPTGMITGLGMSGPVGDLRVFLAARRRAGRYLAVRGLPRPQVPWWRLRSSS